MHFATQSTCDEGKDLCEYTYETKNYKKLSEQISKLWRILVPVMCVSMEASSKRTCTRKQVGEHQIVGFCGEHISDTMKDGHPTLFKEGPEGSLLPMVPVKDVCAPVIGIPHKKLI